MNTKEEMKEVECDREKGQGRCKKEKLQVSITFKSREEELEEMEEM